MSDTQPQQVAPAPAYAPAKRKSKVLLMFLVFVLALLAFGAAVYFSGGVGYLTSLLGPSTNPGIPAAAATPTSAPEATSTTLVTTSTASETALQLPPGVTPLLAKRMYVEQIQSQANLRKMSEGLITHFVVTSVEFYKDKNRDRDGYEDRAAVFVIAYFKDGTSSRGVIQWVRPKDTPVWYFMSFEGLNKIAGGYAETVQRGTIAEGLQTNEEVIAQEGVTVFDYGVINTFLAEQTSNQTVIKRVLAGTLDGIKLGVPTAGVNTTLVPADYTEKNQPPLAGEAVLIYKTVDFEDLIFLTAFREK